MRIVVALDGNDLAQDDRSMGSDLKRARIKTAAQALAPVAFQHQLVLTCGNCRRASIPDRPVGARAAPEQFKSQNELMIGHLLEQELSNQLPLDVPFATVSPMVEIDPRDATPLRILESEPIRWLVEYGTVVVCAAPRPVTYLLEDVRRTLAGVAVPINADQVSQVVARDLSADLLVFAGDMNAVDLNPGTSDPMERHWVTPSDLRQYGALAGSVGSKIDAAIRFAEQTGGQAAIGSLKDIEKIIAGETGTHIARVIPANYGGLPPTRQRKEEQTWISSAYIPR